MVLWIIGIWNLQVMFVDYGNVEWVPLNYVCEIPDYPPELWELPMQVRHMEHTQECACLYTLMNVYVCTHL